MRIDITNGGLEVKDKLEYESGLKILFTGDLCPLNRTEEIIRKGESNNIIKSIQPILHDKDILISNIEAPITNADTPIKKSGPNLKLDLSCIEFIKTAGIDVACLANNHIGDYGNESVLETIDILRKNNINTVGAGKTKDEAVKPLIMEKNGRRIAVLAYAENEFGTAEERKPGSSPLDPLNNIRQIKDVSKSVDITLVIIHGGNEYNPIPSPRMVKTCRSFAEAGAAAVVAMHTHCPQGFEIFNRIPIIYSLGNFLFDIPSKEMIIPEGSYWWRGYMAGIWFSDENMALGFEITPYEFGPEATGINLLTGTDREKFLKYLLYISGLIVDRKELELLWRGWCAIKGPKWLKYLEGAAYLPEEQDGKDFKKVLESRNAFTCEAHNELITTFLRMVCDGSVETAREQMPRIEKLQKGIIA